MLERSWTFGGTEAAATFDFALKMDFCKRSIVISSGAEKSYARAAAQVEQLSRSGFRMICAAARA